MSNWKLIMNTPSRKEWQHKTHHEIRVKVIHGRLVDISPEDLKKHPFAGKDAPVWNVATDVNGHQKVRPFFKEERAMEDARQAMRLIEQIMARIGGS